MSLFSEAEDRLLNQRLAELNKQPVGTARWQYTLDSLLAVLSLRTDRILQAEAQASSERGMRPSDLRARAPHRAELAD